MSFICIKNNNVKLKNISFISSITYNKLKDSNFISKFKIRQKLQILKIIIQKLKNISFISSIIYNKLKDSNLISE